jgi:hypothetical protein
MLLEGSQARLFLAELFFAELWPGAINGGLPEGGETIAHDQDSGFELLAVPQLQSAAFNVGSNEWICFLRCGRQCRANCVCECSRRKLP